MLDRSFTETELREMLEQATNLRSDSLPGRWVVETTHSGKAWEVIVEPDTAATLVIVVTAYPIG
jgi:hypothetical protein